MDLSGKRTLQVYSGGLKIHIATKLASNHLDISTSILADGREDPSMLVSFDDIDVQLSPNSAVLFIMGSANPENVQVWLDWETYFQELLGTYLVNRSSALLDAVRGHLTTLDDALLSPPNFILGGLTAADVILYAAFYGFREDKELSNLLQSFIKIKQYLEYLAAIKEFKEGEDEYFKSSAAHVTQHKHAGNYSRENCLWNLLGKSADEKPTFAQNSKVKETRCSAVKEEGLQFTEEEIQRAKSEWERNRAESKGVVNRRPVLPVEGENNILITSALPYVNNVPHLGNIIGCVLSADCFARFCRLRGDNVLYICGTDEYGTATETKAVAEGVTPQQICEKYNKIHSDIYEWFNISFDHFGRTTTHFQTEIAQSIFWDLVNNSKITKNIVEQLYCTDCKIFLADRFVEGVCPHPGCGFQDARGDQCDGCGKLVNAIDLIQPRCKFCSKTPIVKQSQHLFLDLPTLESDLQDWFKSSSEGWSSNAKGICESWLRDGLKERCITRDLKWGTPVPMEGFKDKVFYVWYDAPIGYISITMDYTEEWAKWWKDPDRVRYYQFMAKDNVPFHGVIFPSTLLGTNRVWTKVNHLIATEYLNYEDGKFSKSRGVGVFGNQAKDTGIVSDVWRFYLLYVRPETHDSSFSWSDVQAKNNSELLNNIGNFVNRALKFVYQFYGGQLPEVHPNSSDYTVMAGINKELEVFFSCLSGCRLRDGIRAVLSITRLGNQYIQENEPYKLIKPDRCEEDKKRGASVINLAANIVGLVGVMLEPYMPDMSNTILDILGRPSTLQFLPSALGMFMKPGHRIREPYPLVRKITDDEIEALRKKFGGSGDQPKSTDGKNTTKEDTVPTANSICVSQENVDRLTSLVTEQGNKVRELKQNKASKEQISQEVAVLLGLKKQLMTAQGLDPEEEAKKSGKKKKK